MYQDGWHGLIGKNEEQTDEGKRVTIIGNRISMVFFLNDELLLGSMHSTRSRNSNSIEKTGNLRYGVFPERLHHSGPEISRSNHLSMCVKMSRLKPILLN